MVNKKSGVFTAAGKITSTMSARNSLELLRKFQAVATLLLIVRHINSSLTFIPDEQSFQTFATYCGLALHHAKVKFPHYFQSIF